jgi:hypothetical protein
MVDAVAEQMGSASLAALVRARDGAPNMERAVAVVGLSDTSVQEAAGLRDDVPVLLVNDVPGRADIARGGDGQVYRLDTADGRRDFVGSLGVEGRAAADLRRVLDQTPSGGRREIAELARIWAPGERGEPIPRRLMVTGHGDGVVFMGNDHDSIRSSDVVALARAMPRAAAQIDSIHLAACQHGYEPRLRPVIDAFPNLSSAWGYAGFSPLGAPARHHQGVWERGSRGMPEGGGRLRRTSVRGTRRAQSVAVWTRDGGFTGPTVRQLSVLGTEARGRHNEFQRFLSGEREVVDPMNGFLAEHYQLLQELTGHHDFGDQRDAYRAGFARERDQALRLRYFATHVTPQFARAYRRELSTGYRSLGLTPPDFSSMGRRQAVAEIARFERAMEQSPDAPSVRRTWDLLSRGLRDLDPTLIPTRWL